MYQFYWTWCPEMLLDFIGNASMCLLMRITLKWSALSEESGLVNESHPISERPA